MNLAQLLTLAFLVEALWETLKMTWQNGKLQMDRIGALALGIALSLLGGCLIFRERLSLSQIAALCCGAAAVVFLKL